MVRSSVWACVSLYLAFSSSIVFPEVAAEDVDDLTGPQRPESQAQLDEPYLENATHRRWHSKSKATEVEIANLLSIIEEQLDPWKDGISLEMVERLYCNAREYAEQATVRFQVINGRPYVVGAMFSHEVRAQSMMAQVMNLATKFRLPDVDFLLSTADHCPDLEDPKFMELRTKQEGASNCTRNAPLLAFGKREEQKQCITVPDWSFENWPEANMPNWSTVRAWMLYAADQRPFSKRLPKVFWRGGMTHWQRFIEFESEIVKDSGLFDEEKVDWWGDRFQRNEAWISLAKHCDYQRLLHMRGNGYSNRLKSIMLCGSPVIFPFAQAFAEREFWYHMLIDRHNIMLPPAVTDENQAAEVVAAATELGSNKRLSQEIAISGQHLVAEVLHPDNVDKYWMALFEQYNKLQSFRPTLHLDARPLEEELLRPYRFIDSKDRTCNVC